MNTEDIAYFAGYFDGEGSIFIRVKTRKTRRSPNHELVCSITSKNKIVCESFKAHFRGHTTSWLNKLTDKKMWYWQSGDRQALSFLQAVYPFLRQKREEAEIALKFQLDKKSLSLEERENVRQELHILKDNHRVLKTLEEYNGLLAEVS